MPFNFSDGLGGLAKFAKSVFSEPDGSGSASRVLMACMVSFVLGAGVTFVTHVHGPITMNDFDTFLGAAAVFITTTCAPLYAINKSADAYKNKGPNPPDHEGPQDHQ